MTASPAGAAQPPLRPPFDLGPMPRRGTMVTRDEAVVRADPRRMFEVVRDVLRWPEHLPHYRFVRFHETDGRGGGVVEMSAGRPFGALNWPTWWLSEMEIVPSTPAVRFRHIGGVTTGMHVEWKFDPHPEGTHVRLLHVWSGPRWPLVGSFAAKAIIGPVFVHGIASRTLAGLAGVAERATGRSR